MSAAQIVGLVVTGGLLLVLAGWLGGVVAGFNALAEQLLPSEAREVGLRSFLLIGTPLVVGVGSLALVVIGTLR